MSLLHKKRSSTHFIFSNTPPLLKQISSVCFYVVDKVSLMTYSLSNKILGQVFPSNRHEYNIIELYAYINREKYLFLSSIIAFIHRTWIKATNLFINRKQYEN